MTLYKFKKKDLTKSIDLSRIAAKIDMRKGREDFFSEANRQAILDFKRDQDINPTEVAGNLANPNEIITLETGAKTESELLKILGMSRYVSSNGKIRWNVCHSRTLILNNRTCPMVKRKDFKHG